MSHRDIGVFCLSAYLFVRSMPSSRLVVACTSKQRSPIFLPNAVDSLGGLIVSTLSTHLKHSLQSKKCTHLFSTSKIAPFAPAVTTLTPASFFNCSTTLTPPPFPLPSPTLPFTAVPLLFSPATAIYFILSCTTAFRNASFANSLTSTTSGAYGERPPKPKRAVTSARAAAPKSALRSTRATARAAAGEISEADVDVDEMLLSACSLPLCSTEMTLDVAKKEEGGRVGTMAKMSWSRAVLRSWRMTGGRVWRVVSSCVGGGWSAAGSRQKKNRARGFFFYLHDDAVPGGDGGGQRHDDGVEERVGGRLRLDVDDAHGVAPVGRVLAVGDAVLALELELRAQREEVLLDGGERQVELGLRLGERVVRVPRCGFQNRGFVRHQRAVQAAQLVLPPVDVVQSAVNCGRADGGERPACVVGHVGCGGFGVYSLSLMLSCFLALL